MVKALLFIHQPDRVARKASDVSAADWRYQTHVKKYRNFSRVLSWLFSGLEILVQHRSLYDNTKLPCDTLPPTQHHSFFFRNLPPLLFSDTCLREWDSSSLLFSSQTFRRLRGLTKTELRRCKFTFVRFPLIRAVSTKELLVFFNL